MEIDVPPGEVIYSDDRVKQIGGLYEAAKENLTDILSDLVPASWCQKPVNPRITILYNQIAQLRDHCFDIKENENQTRTETISITTIEQQIIRGIIDKFNDFNVEEILMTISDVEKAFLTSKCDHSYINNILDKELKLYKHSEVRRYSYPYWYVHENGDKTRQEMSSIGRPFLFKKSFFIQLFNENKAS